MEHFTDWWLTALYGMILTGIVAFTRYLYRVVRAIKKGLQALLRDRIVQMYTHYMEKEWAPIYAQENMSALVREYLALDGNGTVPQLYDEFKCLPKVPHGKKDC